jgi:hypothetical protein
MGLFATVFSFMRRDKTQGDDSWSPFAAWEFKVLGDLPVRRLRAAKRPSGNGVELL